MKRINSNSMSYLWNLVFYYYFQYFLIFESIFTTEMRFWMLVLIFRSKSAHKWIKTISIACLHVYLHGGCIEIIFQLTYLSLLFSQYFATAWLGQSFSALCSKSGSHKCFLYMYCFTIVRLLNWSFYSFSIFKILAGMFWQASHSFLTLAFSFKLLCCGGLKDYHRFANSSCFKPHVGFKLSFSILDSNGFCFSSQKSTLCKHFLICVDFRIEDEKRRASDGF